MALPSDYTERVYAGVLGKIIGVYLGRPFEGWWYDRIQAELGDITYYVNDRIAHHPPLIVTDDDISGTFTFVRALADYGNTPDLSPAQIGQSWLNYIIENRTILWWGGMGNSTEHTAYLRLKQGFSAPESGSIAANGKVVAEQIGAQIFIDGWAMVAPGNPLLAAELARRAASVSHDGEAIYGAQVIAAMEAQAFVEPDLEKLLEVGVACIPPESVIARMIADLRRLRQTEPDWRQAYRWLSENYGYDQYGGNCHMVPNHGLIILSLLYGDDDFHKTLMIVNTCGWDTDCNSANVGCLMGIKLGLAGIEAGPDWRGPVADRLYLAAADGGRVVTDAVIETYYLVNSGRALAGLPPLAPKGGARYHFELPGAVQGFTARSQGGVARLENVAGHSRLGARSLAVHYSHLSPGCPINLSTATFIPPEAITMPGYGLMASPTLYAGQTARLGLAAGDDNASPLRVQWVMQIYNAQDQPEKITGPQVEVMPGETVEMVWTIPDTGGLPIFTIGVDLHGPGGAAGTIYLDYLTWEGIPTTALLRPFDRAQFWRKAWVNGVDHLETGSEPLRLIQDRGLGLVSQGTRQWQDYQARATLTPHMAQAFGLGVRVQGMARYYALLLGADGRARLVKALDGVKLLAETAFPLEFGRAYTLSLRVSGNRIQAEVDGALLLAATDDDRPLTGGGVALLVDTGRVSASVVQVGP